MQSDKNYRLPRARGGRGLTKVFTKFCSNHEIFTTKIKTFANLERFTKFLWHENLELYGTFKCETVFVIYTVFPRIDRARTIDFSALIGAWTNRGRGLIEGAVYYCD